MTIKAEDFIIRSENAIAIHGLPEEVVAMLFGKYSRSSESVVASLQSMIDSGDFVPSGVPHSDQSEKTRKFHERITIGYGHKSVADHATVHFALEDVSTLLERDFMSARLIAATSKSTRFVNFKDAGFVTPEEIRLPQVVDQYDVLCRSLLEAYEKLAPMATEAVRAIVPFDASVWKSEAGWRAATEKRGLDMIRDVLPASVKTSFGVSCSATALRELLDKRWSFGTAEVRNASNLIRQVTRGVVPTLLPEEARFIAREPRPETRGYQVDYAEVEPHVRLLAKSPWEIAERAAGMDRFELAGRWLACRGHHMPPDRSAEFLDFTFEVMMPFAIHRDLGRHRMMTQVSTELRPTMGYGCDPLFTTNCHHPLVAVVAKTRREALSMAHNYLAQWMILGEHTAVSYASPLATNVLVMWKVNLRELVHLIGLRTTPQGHPSYRHVAQMVSRTIFDNEPLLRPLLSSITNDEYIIVGRPG